MSSYVCPECGLDYDTVTPADAALAIRSFARRYGEAMADIDDDVLAQRPAPEVWSAIEYASHVAQLYGPMAEAQRRIREEDHPEIRWERMSEPSVVPSAEVLADLRARADVLAAEIEATRADQWQREGTLPWGDRDALTMARNAVHEGSHHLRDIQRGLTQLGATTDD